MSWFIHLFCPPLPFDCRPHFEAHSIRYCGQHEHNTVHSSHIQPSGAVSLQLNIQAWDFSSAHCQRLELHALSTTAAQTLVQTILPCCLLNAKCYQSLLQLPWHMSICSSLSYQHCGLHALEFSIACEMCAPAQSRALLVHLSCKA